MCSISLRVVSSTMGWPVGVNFLGFHPKSERYSPICFREPRLKCCNFLRMKGFLGRKPFIISSYSSSVNPLFDKVPSFFVKGLTSLSSTHLGLNVL